MWFTGCVVGVCSANMFRGSLTMDFGWLSPACTIPSASCSFGFHFSVTRIRIRAASSSGKCSFRLLLIMVLITFLWFFFVYATGCTLGKIVRVFGARVGFRRVLVVIGSPLQPHIEHIIRNKAASLSSPVLSACDAGAKSRLRFFGREEVPYQCCEIHIEHKDTTLFLDFPEVKLQMIGKHQLQNAVTATCTAFCLQNQGWRISNQSIQAGLEKTRLPGRGQFLTKEETETFGLPGVSILLDGAHTEASAKGLTNIIKMEDPDGALALVVSMASDKDHMSFAVQLLTGLMPEVVILTETSIAGSRSRSTSAFTLKDTWFRAATNLGISVLDFGTFDHGNTAEFPAVCPGQMNDKQIWLMACPNAPIGDSMQIADQLLRSRAGEKPHLVVVTGSLHIVSSVLACINSCCWVS